MMNNPSAEQVALPAVATSVPDRLLNEGEIVVLSIKPSAWFVVMVSWQVLAVAVVIPLVAYLAEQMLGRSLPIDRGTLNSICLIAAVARLFAASMQWMSRLYVLTNLRVLRVKGLLRPDIWSCLLTQITEVRMWPTPLKLTGLGSLQFICSSARPVQSGQAATDTAWIHIAHAAKVQQVIQANIGKLK